jgi:rhodanese-related sulfurtransferase
MVKTRIKQALALLVIALALAIVANLISHNNIPLIGWWPSVSGSDTVAVPPSAEKGDPPFISLDEAAALYQSDNVLFIDSRDPEDYRAGRIKNAVNLPFDSLEDHWDGTIPSIPKDRTLVIYCSGTECELSLLLAREFVYRGYKKVYVFFGGWREWEKARLPVERGKS